MSSPELAPVGDCICKRHRMQVSIYGDCAVERLFVQLADTFSTVAAGRALFKELTEDKNSRRGFFYDSSSAFFIFLFRRSSH